MRRTRTALFAALLAAALEPGGLRPPLAAAAAPLAAIDPGPSKALVVVVLSFDCPVSNSYAAPLGELSREFAGRGVRFVGVCPGCDDRAALDAAVKEYRLPFPVHADPDNAVTDALKAVAMPEAFVLDAGRAVRYRGRIDDAWSARLKKNAAVRSHDLRDALAAVLDGKPVREAVTRPVGCPVNPAKPPAKDGAVTFHRDVLPVLQAHCQSCHRQGGVGPFALTTYRQAVNWADDVAEYTKARKMPPWKPVAGPEFHGSRRLPDKDIATLAAWAAGGTPEGDPKDAPPPAKFTDGWSLGRQPDLVLTVDEDFHLGPTGPDLFRCFVLPTGLTEDKYVVAVEVRPGNRRAVHHSLNFFDTTGTARKMAADAKAAAKPADADRGPGYTSAMSIGFRPKPRPDGVPTVGGLGGWAPGQIGRYLPAGSGYYLPKGSDLVLQVHYHRTGRAETDRTTIGLYFADTPVATPYQSLVIPGRVLFIPAGAANYRVSGRVRVDQDCTIHSVMPHMHLIGKSVKVTMTPPGGAARTLVVIDDWDYNWQETYAFKEPIRVSAGTVFEIEAAFDNSAANPNNPNSPPRAVFFGEETTNEMLFGFVGATSDTPGRIRTTRNPPAERAVARPAATDVPN